MKCERCDATNILTGINGKWFCPSHIEEGFHGLGDLLREIRQAVTGNHVFTYSSRHPEAVRCLSCKTDLGTTAVTKLVYSLEICECGIPEYAHLVEQHWHRTCFITAAIPEGRVLPPASRAQ